MSVQPCGVCGYDSPTDACPHCGGRPREASLAAAPLGPIAGVAAGLVALPRGLAFLLRTRGVKRWLVPPLVLTSSAFAALVAWAWIELRAWVDTALPGEVALERLDEGRVRSVLEWFLNEGPGLVVVRGASWLVFAVLASVVAWYCFSIVYEAIAGPFLDEVQGRLEARWFGADPRSTLERPSDIPVARCVRNSVLALAAGLVLVLVGWRLGPWWSAPALALAPALVASALDRQYGAWLAWIARIEGEALFVGIQVSLFTALALVVCLPLYLVPLVGPLAYALAAGFATSVSLTDIAFERRQWTLAQRLRFCRRHALALTAFGAMSGLCFAVPLIGPIAVVPCASVGGLWLVCRLDKGTLR